MIFWNEYKLIGIISTPEVGLLKNIKKLKAGIDYYNDGRKENSKITEIAILLDSVINNNPYVGPYTKVESWLNIVLIFWIYY